MTDLVTGLVVRAVGISLAAAALLLLTAMPFAR
jgi:hypothetical protein